MAAFGRADAIVDDAFEGVRDGIMAAEGKGDSDKLNALKNAVTNITTYPDQFSQGARNAASGMKANVDAGIYNPVDFTTMKLELGIDDDVVMGARRRRRGKKSRKPRKPRRMTRRRTGGDQEARRSRVATMLSQKPAPTPAPKVSSSSSSTPQFDDRVVTAAERNLGFPSAQRGENLAQKLLNKEQEASYKLATTTAWTDDDVSKINDAQRAKNEAKWQMKSMFGSKEATKKAAKAQQELEDRTQYMNPMFGRSRRRHRSKRHTQRR